MMLYKKSAAYLAEKLRAPPSVTQSNDSDARLEREILRRCYKRDLGEAIKVRVLRSRQVRIMPGVVFPALRRRQRTPA